MSDPRETGSEKLSPLWLKKSFPDAQAIFDSRRSTLEETTATCFVALDANVLLLPYKLDGVSLPDVIEVYRTLSASGRLVVPAQAAREFAKHRATKIGDLTRYLRDQASHAGPMSKTVGALVGYAPFDAVMNEFSRIAAELKDLRKTLNAIADDVAANVGEDPVSIAYRDVFAGVVRDEPAECQDETAFRQMLLERYNERRPPGYKDAGKPDDGAGDLLIWKTILAEGATRQTDCVFVTADEKADWYAQSQGALQPRVELVEEYRAATGRSLHIVRLSKLLEIMKAPKAAVEGVQQAERTDDNVANRSGRILVDMLDRSNESGLPFDHEEYGRQLRIATVEANLASELAWIRNRQAQLKELMAALEEGVANGDPEAMKMMRHYNYHSGLLMEQQSQAHIKARRAVGLDVGQLYGDEHATDQ